MRTVLYYSLAIVSLSLLTPAPASSLAHRVQDHTRVNQRQAHIGAPSLVGTALACNSSLHVCALLHHLACCWPGRSVSVESPYPQRNQPAPKWEQRSESWQLLAA
jgi:hypothetical protein